MPSFSPEQDAALKAVSDWLKEKPGRSTRRSPGRLPKGTPTLPAIHTTNPTTTIASPNRIIHFPNEERSISSTSELRYRRNRNTYYTYTLCESESTSLLPSPSEECQWGGHLARHFPIDRLEAHHSLLAMTVTDNGHA